MKSKQWWGLISCGLLLAPILGNIIFSTTIAKSNETNSSILSINICTNINNWEKPSLDQQIQTLSENERYGKEINEPPLKNLFDELWNNQVFVFTEYGLSARIEPIYLSGTWTVIDDIWDCYTEDTVTKINSGKQGEVWLLGLKFVNLEWKDQQYYLTVESNNNSFQMIQFTRQEKQPSLPLNIVNTQGKNLTYLNLDLPKE
jgi:hypothetical protein